jgi:hypothetical protein
MSATQRRNAGEGADVNDAPTACGQHSAARFLAATETAKNKIPPRLFHSFERDFFRPPQDPVAGNIPQKIKPPKVVIDLCEHAADLLRLGDVAIHRDSPASKFLNLARRIFRAGKMTIRQHQIRPSLCERDRHRAPNAAGCAGNQGYASSEIK